MNEQVTREGSRDRGAGSSHRTEVHGRPLVQSKDHPPNKRKDEGDDPSTTQFGWYIDPPEEVCSI